MFEYIENLKTKPEHIRKRFAFLVSFGITFVIFAGWIASYTFHPSAIITNNKNSIEAPLSSLTAAAGAAWSDLKSMFISSNKVEYSSNAIEIVPDSKN